MKISWDIGLRTNHVTFHYDYDRITCIDVKMKTLEIRMLRCIEENTHKDKIKNNDICLKLGVIIFRGEQLIHL